MIMPNKNNSSKLSEFREITEYRPSGVFQKEFRSLNNYKCYFTVGRLPSSSYFYKYLDLDSALKSINGGNILFSEPSRWQDKYESRFYTADYSNLGIDETKDCPLLFANCMTTKRNNEAAWVLYTYGKTGSGAYCVEFQINKQKLRMQLLKSLEENDKIYEGVVLYRTEYIINNLHRKQVADKDNTNYQRFIATKSASSFFANYLNLLLMKRDAFQHENETRFYVLKDKKKGEAKAQLDAYGTPGQKIFLSIDWIDIIEKVYVNAKEGSEEYNKLSDALKAKLEKKYFGISDPIQLDEKNQIWETKLKPVPFFIYDEPNSSRLVIE